MSQSGSREILILGSGAAGKHLARHVAAPRGCHDLPPSVGFGRRDAVMVNKVPDSSSC